MTEFTCDVTGRPPTKDFMRWQPGAKKIQNAVLKFPTDGTDKRTSTVLINGPEDEIPPPTVLKFRTVRKITVLKFRTLLLVNQGRVVWGWSWAGLVMSGWLQAALAAEGKECNAPKGSLGGRRRTPSGGLNDDRPNQ
jgi:hypothetical protein